MGGVDIELFKFHFELVWRKKKYISSTLVSFKLFVEQVGLFTLL